MRRYFILLSLVTALLSSCSAGQSTFYAAFDADSAVFNTNGKLYKRTMELGREYAIEDKYLCFFSGNELSEKQQQRIAKAYALENAAGHFFVLKNGEALNAFLKKKRIQVLYSANDEYIKRAKESGCAAVRTLGSVFLEKYKTGKSTLNKRNLLSLYGPFNELILLQYEIRPKLRVPIESRFIYFADGDTIGWDGLYFRFLGCDAAELAKPHHGLPGQEPHGTFIKEYVRKRVKSVREIGIAPAEHDYYSRTLAHIFIDGESLSLELIKKSLAYETVNSYGANGFFELSREILRAAKKAPKPAYRKPYLYRKEHRK